MKKLIVLVIATMLVSSLTFIGIGCKEEVAVGEVTEEEEVGEVAEEATVVAAKLKFGITNPSTAEWYMNCVQGFTDYCTENNIEVALMQTLAPQDAVEQANHVDQMIVQDLDAIGIIVSDGDVLVSAVEACHTADIPVGTPGAEVNIPKFADNDVDVRVVGDNYIPALKLGKYMGQVMGGKGNVVIISGIPGIGVSIDRDGGVNDGLKEYPDIKVLDDQPGMWDAETEYSVMSDFLVKHKKIDAVFGGHDAGSLVSREAAEAVGRVDEMLYFGFGGDSAGFEAIAKGELKATCSMNSYNLGYLLARDLHSAVIYPRFQRVFLEVEFPLITRDNLLDLYPEYEDLFVE